MKNPRIGSLHSRKISSLAVAAALTASLTAAAAPSGEHPQGGYVTVGSQTISIEDFLARGRLTMNESPDADHSRLIDFSQWVQCFTLNDTEMVIKEYVTWSNGIPSSKRLKCGNSEFGYKHIRERHEKDWQAKLDRITFSGLFPNVSWDDLMSAAVVNALMVPDWAENVSGDKRCFVVKMGFYNQNNVLLDAYNVRAVASNSNDRVITALPLKDGGSFCS